MNRIRKILVSQPEPENNKSPYHDLAEKHNLKIDFRPFIHVEGVSAKEFRQEKVDLPAHSAVIFTSKTAIDHFFRIAEETRTVISESMKYFCISEATAFYLQKYIVYRKRKIFYGEGKMEDLVEIMLKHKDEKFLLPLSAAHKTEIPALLDQHKFRFTKTILYRTECSDLSDLADVNYDILVFYSPSGIKSLFQNFPNFRQNDTKIASFGDKTARAVIEAGLRLDIQAPQPQAPSMTMALENFIKDFNKNNGKK
ncbi:MAG: uroporphyrinogen-III synthase [Bacteroidales bacterium]|nr:uroporphyrinogen-III synthase [Bacteroidales bacterium]MBN2699191.1 uroporphyrinogen-III synthase [Bacteroidales bacterium]